MGNVGVERGVELHGKGTNIVLLWLTAGIEQIKRERGKGMFAMTWLSWLSFFSLID
jgi:hypothetical protein